MSPDPGVYTSPLGIVVRLDENEERSVSFSLQEWVWSMLLTYPYGRRLELYEYIAYKQQDNFHQSDRQDD